MQYALVDANGVIQNLIIYDGETPYMPAAGLTIQQVNDWVRIGQPTNTPQPVPLIPAPPIPDLATQLAALLVANGTIASTDLNSSTLAQVNATLTASGKTAITTTISASSIGE